jgi:hypothetical protein
MLMHLVRVGAITAFILLCTVLPFLPGRYDNLAVPLSAMAQVVGITGLLLVPIGGLWLGFEHRRRRGGSGEGVRTHGGDPRRGYYAVHASSHARWKYFWFD